METNELILLLTPALAGILTILTQIAKQFKLPTSWVHPTVFALALVVVVIFGINREWYELVLHWIMLLTGAVGTYEVVIKKLTK